MAGEERGLDKVGYQDFDRLVQEATRSVEQELALEDSGWYTLGSNSYAVIQPIQRFENVRASRLYCVRDPLAFQSIRLWTDYTFGTGMSYNAKDEKTQIVLDKFWQDPDNRPVLSASGQRKLSDKANIDGELFFVVFLGTKGKATIRSIEPLEITEIISDPDDIDSVLYYRRDWSDQQGHYHTTYYRSATNLKNEAAIDSTHRGVSATDEGIVFHKAFNTISQRGNPLMLPALDWLKQYRKFLAARVAIMLAMARFAWRLKVKGGQAAVDAQSSKLSTEDGAPAAASTIAENEGVDMSPIKTDTGAKNAIDDGKMLKLQVFTTAGFPETYYGDVSVGSLATAKTVELPVIKMIQSRQQIFEDLFQDIDELVMAHNKIAPTNWYVDRNWPPITPRDALAFADAVSKVVASFPSFGGSEAVMQATLTALGIDDTAEVIAQLDKNIAANPEAAELRVLQQVKQILESIRRRKES